MYLASSTLVEIDLTKAMGLRLLNQVLLGVANGDQVEIDLTKAMGLRQIPGASDDDRGEKSGNRPH